MLVLLSISGVRPPERWVAIVSGVTVSVAAISAVLLGVITFLPPRHEYHEVLWTMYSVGHYHLDISIFVDPLSAMLTFLGGCTIPVLARFSGRYLHRDPGYLRFFVLVGVASTGFFWFVLGGGIDMAFFGWELLGLSSALLVCYFWDRPETVVASGRVFATYRVADIALLMGMVMIHHYVGDVSWPTVLSLGNAAHELHAGAVATTILCLAFLIAAMGKSALMPLTGYILKAMEGPTPSSALFYGTLSIHCGVYLILRVEPLLEDAPIARATVVAVGLFTAVTAALSSRVRADGKGALALASASQAGLMVAEGASASRASPCATCWPTASCASPSSSARPRGSKTPSSGAACSAAGPTGRAATSRPCCRGRSTTSSTPRRSRASGPTRCSTGSSSGRSRRSPTS